MKVCKRGANVFIDFVAARRSEEFYFGGRKRIILSQLKDPVVVTSPIRPIKIKENKVKVKYSFALNQNIR